MVAVARRREGGVALAQIAKDFGISESCLNLWLKAADVEAGVKPGSTDLERAELRKDLEFGYRLLVDEAREAGGRATPDRTAWRICSANGWWSVFGMPKAYAKARRAGAPAHSDLVARDFTADEPNQLWLTDITEHWTVRASSTSARSRTCGPTGSSATPSTRG